MASTRDAKPNPKVRRIAPFRARPSESSCADTQLGSVSEAILQPPEQGIPEFDKRSAFSMMTSTMYEENPKAGGILRSFGTFGTRREPGAILRCTGRARFAGLHAPLWITGSAVEEPAVYCIILAGQSAFQGSTIALARASQPTAAPALSRPEAMAVHPGAAVVFSPFEAVTAYFAPSTKVL